MPNDETLRLAQLFAVQPDRPEPQVLTRSDLPTDTQLAITHARTWQGANLLLAVLKQPARSAS